MIFVKTTKLNKILRIIQKQLHSPIALLQFVWINNILLLTNIHKIIQLISNPK